MALYQMDLGIDTSRLLTMQMALPIRKYRSSDERNAFIKRVEDRLAAVGALQGATIASNWPLGGGRGIQLTIDGRANPERLPIVTMLSVGPTYFDTIGTRLIRGRSFVESDGTSGQAGAIVNQRFVQMYFASEDPIGKRVRLTDEVPNPNGPPLPAFTIVGVSPTVRQRNPQNQPNDPDADSVVYILNAASTQQGSGQILLVRTRSDSAQATALLREEIRAIDPDLPLYNIRTMDQNLAQQRWPFRVFGTMFAIFAFVALVLSAVGLYAITAYSVTQRTQEIGVRMALGAQARQVWWLIARRSLIQLGIGLAIGMPGAFGVGILLKSLLVQTSSSDPATLISIAALLTIVAVTACYWPARRATRLDPLVALRYE
jgi:putative ABC transport system permease protein